MFLINGEEYYNTQLICAMSIKTGTRPIAPYIEASFMYVEVIFSGGVEKRIEVKDRDEANNFIASVLNGQQIQRFK